MCTARMNESDARRGPGRAVVMYIINILFQVLFQLLELLFDRLNQGPDAGRLRVWGHGGVKSNRYDNGD